MMCEFCVNLLYYLITGFQRDEIIKLLNSLWSNKHSLCLAQCAMIFCCTQCSDCNQLFVYFCFVFYFCRMQQPPLSSSGSTSLQSRRQDMNSPTPSDDSDSDISLGTHSPVPSSLSLQHSPGSTSGGGNDRDDRLQEDRDKDYRSFSLSSFRFDTHSPGMAGE